MNLGAVGEDRLLAQLLPGFSANDSVLLGAGDDCAVVRGPGPGNFLLLKTDCVVEGIHFKPNSPPQSVGWKAMARPLSDFAAMSGVPRFALVTLVISARRRIDWVKGLYRGLGTAGKAYHVAIVGGETSNINGPSVISVSVSGFVEKARWVGRSGAKAGDELFVSGRLGGSLRGKHLKFTPRIEEARWLTKNFVVHAMMDVSDGLGTDLPRLAEASGLGFEIDQASVPLNPGCTLRQAVSDGEDYELLFAISPETSSKLKKRWCKRFPTLPLTRIGKLNSKFEIRNSKLRRGYVHFE
jgi:thiamine-monophosphate kinase